MSPILAQVARRRFLASRPTQLRSIQTMVSTKTSGKASPDWGYQWKKVGGTVMMYVPVVAVVMFWPYTVKPVMDRIRW